MRPRISLIAGIVSFALLAGCVAAVIPPSSFPHATAPSAVRRLQRGAVSGVAQRVGFFYAVNADCTSSGLMHLNVETPPAHGTVSFAVIRDYPRFRPANRQYYECNHRKVPGVGVIYQSADGFTGADRFLVEGVGPKGGLFKVQYVVTVLSRGTGNP